MKALRRVILVTALATLAGLAAGCTASPNTGRPATSGETVSCSYSASGSPAKPVELPNGTNVPATGQYQVTMAMDAGDVIMNFDRSNAPCAVNSFESLASQGYFDDTVCHRLEQDFVLQCGDPSASGFGGPGYRYDDELTGQETYTYGVVAMANSGADTNGSQFFIVLGETVNLSADYVILGTVESGSMPVIQSIADQGVDPSDPRGTLPAEGGHIKTVTGA